MSVLTSTSIRPANHLLLLIKNNKRFDRVANLVKYIIFDYPHQSARDGTQGLFAEYLLIFVREVE